jgi:hypothetical protein
MKQKGLRQLGICNINKRRDLVYFDWRVGQDVLLPRLRWYIAGQMLGIHCYKTRKTGGKWFQCYKISPYLADRISKLCAERWP